MKKKTLIILILFLSIFLTSCKEVNNAKTVVDNFYEYRQSKNYEKILTLLSDDIYRFTTEEQIISDLKAIDKKMGNLNLHKSIGFNISTINGKTTTSFNYKIIYDKGVMMDSILLIKEKNEYKIFYYEWKKQ